MNFSLPPWTIVGKSNAFKISANDMQAKVLYCMALENALSMNHPHPKAWMIVQSKKWLKDHAITAEDDVSFILQAISEHLVVACCRNQVDCCHCHIGL